MPKVGLHPLNRGPHEGHDSHAKCCLIDEKSCFGKLFSYLSKPNVVQYTSIKKLWAYGSFYCHGKMEFLVYVRESGQRITSRKVLV